MAGGQQNPGGGGQYELVGIAAGVGAAFFWADPAFEFTLEAFRNIAVRNYGYDVLAALEWVYWAFLHIAIFAITRVAVQWAIVALVSAVSYRLVSAYPF